MYARKQSESSAENTEITPPPLPRKNRRARRPIRSDSHLKAVKTDTPKPEQPEPPSEPPIKLSKAEQNVPHVFELEHISESAAQEDSVLLQAMKLRRNPLERLVHSISTLRAQVESKMQRNHQTSKVQSKNALGRLESDKSGRLRKYQSILIGTTIVIGMFFVGFSLVSSNATYPESNTTTATPPPLKLDDIPLDYHPPTELPTLQPAEKSHHAEIAQPASPVTKTQPASIALAAEKDANAIFYTNRRTWLRSKTSKKAIKVLRLPKNARIKTHPDFPTKDGWVLATTKRGHLGFIMKKYLKIKGTK